ncbi:carbohydrate ABC transporter permease [Candidatus Bipolaricaulota bacterium]|nr:carbohydrate ABC transporter permease [Candidatus Bipolaricaulota bacterium]
MSKRRVLWIGSFYLIAIVISLLWLFPLFIAGTTAFKSMNEIVQNIYWWNLPDEFTFQYFAEAWNQGGMSRYFLNSFIITVPSVVGALFLSALGGFALAKYRFKYNKLILGIFIAGNMIPFQMMMFPVFEISNVLGLYDTYLAVILFHVSFQMGFCIFFLRNFIRTIPTDLLDAARVDGSSEFRIFLQIVLPLTKPALAALGILEFTWIWNDYLWGLVLLASDNLRPVTVGLVSLQGEYLSKWNIISAGSLIAAAVPLIVFLVFQRYFIQGLMMGASK